MAGITIDFNANLAQLQSGLNEANAELRSFGDRAAEVGNGVREAFAAIGIGLSVAGFGALVKATIDEADALDVLSQKTGVAVETLAGLKLGAQLNDTQIEAVGSAMNRLGRQIAVSGDEFEKLGITAKDPLIALEQAADVFSSIEDPMQRAAVVNKLFGKSWEELAPLLAGGGQALAELVAQGTKMSGITTDLAGESAKFNDSIDLLTANLVGFRNQAVGPLVPILNDLSEFFAQTADSASDGNGTIKALSESYKLLAESVVVVDFGFQVLGKSAGALLAKLDALLHLDTTQFAAIDQAFKEDLAAADKRLLDFFARVEGFSPKVDIKADVQVDNKSVTAPPELDTTKSKQAVADFLKIGDDGEKIISQQMKTLQVELTRHLGILKGGIEEESGLFDFRNKKLEAALDLGLIDQASYFREKERLQKEQLQSTEAVLDQEINALQQFQDKATDQATKDGAQEKINDLLRQKSRLEQDSQIATLQNAAAAQQALGAQASGLIDINGLLDQQYQTLSNIIGLSKAQADITLQSSAATGADVVDRSKIFVSADGTSFSDRPTEVGVTLDLSQNEIDRVDQQIAFFRDQAVADSAILLGVNIDEAAALAKINDASSAINQRLDEIRPVALGVEVSADSAISATQRARDAAQAAVQPVVIPVVYAAQNTPASATSTNNELTRAALAQGGR